MIKRANENDILVIEDILLDTVLWMKKKGLENQWTEKSIKWNALKKDYKISNFYIDYVDDMPAGCMAITDFDQRYWPEIQEKESLYLHKLAVKRSFAGQGVSKELINYAKKLCVEQKINGLRLDCNFRRDKLRELYEKEGFALVRKKNLENKCEMALYVWN